jgi:hypothetical protein
MKQNEKPRCLSEWFRSFQAILSIKEKKLNPCRLRTLCMSSLIFIIISTSSSMFKWSMSNAMYPLDTHRILSIFSIFILSYGFSGSSMYPSHLYCIQNPRILEGFSDSRYDVDPADMPEIQKSQRIRWGSWEYWNTEISLFPWLFLIYNL